MGDILLFSGREKVSTGLIIDRYQKLSDAMDKTKPNPSTPYFDKNWAIEWFERAATLLNPDDQTRIAEDRIVINAWLSGAPVFGRLLSAINWVNLAHLNRWVILADCFNGEEVTDYPTPIVSFVLGDGVSLYNRLHTFDGEITAAAVVEQCLVNWDSQGITRVESLIPAGDDSRKRILHPELLGRLIAAFRLEALSIQSGWEMFHVQEDYLFLAFSQATSMNTVLVWTLRIDTSIYSVE